MTGISRSVMWSAMTALTAAWALSAAEPTGCPDFTVELPRMRGGVVVRAVDYGFSVTNEHNAEAINAALAAAKRLQASRVELSPGEYRCFDGSGVCINGFTDFTFDGKGAVLIFRRDHAPLERQDTLLDDEANVVIRGCERTVVENFNIDWDWASDPLAVWAKCINKHVDERDNESYADFELDVPHPKYPAQVPVQLITPMDANHTGPRPSCERGPRCYFGMCLGHTGAKMEWLSPTRMRIWPYVKPTSGFLAKENEGRYSARGNRYAAKSFDIGGTFTISHRYYGMNGFGLNSNRHLTCRDIDIWACWGLGVETRGAQKYWQLINFNIRSRPGKKYPVTSTADGHHIVQSLGFGKFIGCEVTMNQDDHFNFHDRTQIGDTVDARTLEIVNNRGVGYTMFKVGSLIALRQEDYSLTGWCGRVVAIEGERVRFDRDLPQQTGMVFVLMDCEYATENFVFRNCRFHDTPWSRGVVQGNNLTIENCRFENLVNLPIKLGTCFTYTSWCEGIGCTNIVIRGNRFENCFGAGAKSVDEASVILAQAAICGPDYWPLGYIPILNERFKAKVDARKASGVAWPRIWEGVISSVLIESNVVVNCRGQLLNRKNGSNYIIRDNR